VKQPGDQGIAKRRLNRPSAGFAIAESPTGPQSSGNKRPITSGGRPPERAEYQPPNFVSDQEPKFGRYPLLEALLEEKGLSLQGTYTNRDVANIFIVSVRTIQEWVRNSKIRARDLPGRARFLSEDLEELLVSSRKSSRRGEGEE
jgi:hypothetical protein